VRRRGLLLALALAAATVACGRREREAQIPVVEVKRQKLSRVVEAEGTLRAVRATPVTVPSDAQWPLRITWLAADGADVKKGDPVARFDDLELRVRLANAEADRTVATAKKQKESLLLRATTQDRLRTTEAAQRDLKMAQAFQRRDTAIFSRDQIIEGEIDERLSAAKVDNATASQTVDKRLAQRKLGMIDVEARRADDAIQRSKKGMGALEIKAPHDGVWIVKRTWMGEPFRVGDTVFRSMSIADVSMVEKMEAEVFVLEAEAAGLARGRKAELIVEGRADRPVKAEVKQVETVAKRRQPKSPTQYFGVILSLEKTDPGAMKPGQRVRARLQLLEQEALVVPRPSLFDREGKWIAYRREGGGFLPVTVKLGPSTAGLVAIESGLRERDVIALRDPGKALDELLPAATPENTRRR
jgi:multidrug efflux pump subunit AcrA (membrane-fusion protein)